MALIVPVLRVLEACRDERTSGPLVLRPVAGTSPAVETPTGCCSASRNPRIPRLVGLHSLRHAVITNGLDAGVPLRNEQILARHADLRTIERYDPAGGTLDGHSGHVLTAYVAVV